MENKVSRRECFARGTCDPTRLSDSIEGKFVQGVRKYDKEKTRGNKGTR